MTYPILETYTLPDGTLELNILFQLEHCKSYLCLSFREIREIDVKLFKLFKTFKKLFPDHPDKDNTYLIFLYDGKGRYLSWKILFVCTHFEHNSFSEILKLPFFMNEFATFFNSNPNDVYVNVLQGNGEFLILELLPVDDKPIPKWVKKLMRQRKDLRKTFKVIEETKT